MREAKWAVSGWVRQCPVWTPEWPQSVWPTLMEASGGLAKTRGTGNRLLAIDRPYIYM